MVDTNTIEATESRLQEAGGRPSARELESTERLTSAVYDKSVLDHATIHRLMNGVGPRKSPAPVVGYVPGAWDMFHIGHLNALRFARERCDVLIVGVVTDEELLRIKGRRPIVPLDERIEVVQAVGIVDHAVADHSTNKLVAWEELQFDVLFKGDDWQHTPKGDHLEQEMHAVGVGLQYFPYTQATSSTWRREELLNYE